MQTYVHTVPTVRTHFHIVPTERTHFHIVPTKWTYVHIVGVTIMNSSYCLNMSLCNNHQNNETNISFYNILLNACAKDTCICINQGSSLYKLVRTKEEGEAWGAGHPTSVVQLITASLNNNNCSLGLAGMRKRLH